MRRETLGVTMAEELVGSMSESSGEALGESSSEVSSSSSEGSSKQREPKPPRRHQQALSPDDFRQIPPR